MERRLSRKSSGANWQVLQEMQRIEALSTNATNQRSRTALLGNIQLRTTPIWNFLLKWLLAVQTSNSGTKDDVQWSSAGPVLCKTRFFVEKKNALNSCRFFRTKRNPFTFLFGFGPEISNDFNWLLGVDSVDSSLENRCTGPDSLGLETTGPVDLECQICNFGMQIIISRIWIQLVFEIIYFRS